jgi:integrase
MTPTPAQIEQAREEYRRALDRLAQLGLAEETGAVLEAPRAKRRKTRGRRSGGSVYRRGGVWWVKFYIDGRPIRESSHSTKREAAETLLDTRRGQRARGETVSPKAARLKVSELLDNLARRYRIDGQTVPAANVARLRTAFGPQRAATVTGADWNVYVEKHRSTPERPDGLSNATLNRDLALMRRSYSLARKDFPGFTTRIEFEALTEAAPRSGFFGAEQFAAVCRHLPEYLRGPVTFAWWTGWRKGEVLGLTWPRISFAEGEVRLAPEESKNGEARVFPFTAELRTLLEAQRAATETFQRTKGIIVPTVFHHAGRPIRDLRKAWASACIAAGFFRVVGTDAEGRPVKVPTRLFHDLRRSAVRRFEQAGITRGVAMKLTGHKTESVYRRYAIVSDKDLREAAATLSGGAHGHNSGHERTATVRTLQAERG